MTKTMVASAAERLEALKARYTMTGREVAETFGVSRQHFENMLARGVVRISRVQFVPSRTAPFFYDPKEVSAAFEVYVAAVEASAGVGRERSDVET